MQHDTDSETDGSAAYGRCNRYLHLVDDSDPASPAMRLLAVVEGLEQHAAEVAQAVRTEPGSTGDTWQRPCIVWSAAAEHRLSATSMSSVYAGWRETDEGYVACAIKARPFAAERASART